MDHSERQPVVAIAGAIIAFFLSVVGYICFSGIAAKTGLVCMGIGMIVLPVLTLIKFRHHKTQYGLNGVGAIFYLLNWILLIIGILSLIMLILDQIFADTVY